MLEISTNKRDFVGFSSAELGGHQSFTIEELEEDLKKSSIINNNDKLIGFKITISYDKVYKNNIIYYSIIYKNENKEKTQIKEIENNGFFSSIIMTLFTKNNNNELSDIEKFHSH